MDEKLKKALECCINSKCNMCPLYPELYCDEILTAEAETYIAELEERLAIMQESMETLEQRCNALDALEQRCNDLEKRLKDPDRIKVTRCKDCRFFEPCNVEEGDNSGHCRNDYAPCQNQTVDAWWFCGSAERG